MPDEKTEVDLWRSALARGQANQDLWRSARDFAKFDPSVSPEFLDGHDSSPPALGLDRRQLFKMLGAGAALAGLSGCPERPDRYVVAYAEEPAEQTPDTPVRYASAMVIDGFATGLVAQSYGGRPVKIEGNPEHPASLGATDLHQQASVLELYNPHRAKALLHRGKPATWDRFARVAADIGPRPWFVLYPQTSPLVESLLRQIRTRIPGARFCFHSPIDRSSVYAGSRAVFGRRLETHYDFRAAHRVLALDADICSGMPMSVRWARDFASRRRFDSSSEAPSRLYVVEPCPTPTGTLADHRLAAPARDVAEVAAAVFVALTSLTAYPVPPTVITLAQRVAKNVYGDWARAVARDLAASAGASIVIPGARQSQVTHILAHAINVVLGNMGRTVSLSESALIEPDPGRTLPDLARELSEGSSDTVVIVEANPAYTAPGDFELTSLLAQARRSIHLSLFFNETSKLCQWFVPAAHYLETWGDARAYDGTHSLIQPLIRPLFGGKSVTELLSLFAGNQELDDRQRLERQFRARGIAGESWRRTLQRGFLADSAFPPVRAAIDWSGVTRALERTLRSPAKPGIELAFPSDHAVYDGRYADNGWLQELPRPLTKLTWDNAALLSPSTAVALGVESEQMIELELDGRVLRVPALVLPGHSDNCISLALGYGRTGDEALARGIGANAYLLQSSQELGFVSGVQVRLTNESHVLALSQEHGQLHGREIVLHADLSAYRQDPDFTRAHRGKQPTWLPPVLEDTKGQQWAMTIDTSICSGCSVCMVACQAENNIPIVGKQGVVEGRAMHWININRYFAGPPQDPIILNQPMLCQHCEKAPCEYVCPVFATTHSPDGLNEMVYNRCVGTRFCSNNCPYKVRRFNWFEYRAEKSSTQLQLNPNVTVRSRGVMEKCTYCVQRIRRAGIQARVNQRELRPGEVQSACQQACPTGAIQFGSLAHAETKMVAWRNQPRHYNLLHELGTRPRTVYLARIRNPNPELS